MRNGSSFDRSLDERHRFETPLSSLATACPETGGDAGRNAVERNLACLVDVLKVDDGAFLDIEPDGRVRIRHHAAPEGFGVPEDMLDVAPEWLIQRLARGQAIVWQRIPDSLPVDAVRERAFCEQARLRSWLCIPVRRNGAAIAALSFRSRARSAGWSADIIRCLQAFAAVIENERPRTQAAAENDTKFRALYESNVVPLSYWHADGRVLDANDAYLDLVGYSREELAAGALSWRDLTEPAALELDERATNELRGGRTTATPYEKEYVLRDGRRVPVLISGSLLPGFQDRGVGCVIDLTERKRAEAERQEFALLMQRERRRLEELLANVPGVVWEGLQHGENGAVVTQFVSQHAVELLGYPLSQWREIPDFWLQIVHPDDRERARREKAELFASGRGGSLQFRWLRQDGQALWMEAHVAVVRNAAGEAIGMRGVTMDISERRRAEDEARQHREQLAYLARLATLNELAVAVAHEISQPLNAILNNADAARLKLDRPDLPLAELAVILDDIVASGQRAGRIIQRVRGIVKRTHTKSEPVELNGLLEGVVSLLSSEALIRGSAVFVERSAAPLLVTGDRVQLQQVIINLVSNALEAAAENRDATPSVVVRVFCSGATWAVVAVEDSGPGIAADLLPRLFEPFVSTKDHGLGLGLAITTWIVQAHGGRIYAANNRDRGALLLVALPLVTGERV